MERDQRLTGRVGIGLQAGQLRPAAVVPLIRDQVVRRFLDVARVRVRPAQSEQTEDFILVRLRRRGEFLCVCAGVPPARSQSIVPAAAIVLACMSMVSF
jgi:hypothetical protein